MVRVIKNFMQTYNQRGKLRLATSSLVLYIHLMFTEQQHSQAQAPLHDFLVIMVPQQIEDVGWSDFHCEEAGG